MAMKRGESKKFKRLLSHLLADSTMTVKPDVEGRLPDLFSSLFITAAEVL